MEETLRELSILQIEALKRQISFRIDLEAGYDKEAPAISLYLQSYERDKKGRYYQSTHLESCITSDLSKEEIKERIDAIKHFVLTVISSNE